MYENTHTHTNTQVEAGEALISTGAESHDGAGKAAAVLQ